MTLVSDSANSAAGVPIQLADILENAQAQLSYIRETLAKMPDHFPLALSLPTLDLPPIFHTPSWQLSEAESV